MSKLVLFIHPLILLSVGRLQTLRRQPVAVDPEFEGGNCCEHEPSLYRFQAKREYWTLGQAQLVQASFRPQNEIVIPAVLNPLGIRSAEMWSSSSPLFVILILRHFGALRHLTQYRLAGTAKAMADDHDSTSIEVIQVGKSSSSRAAQACDRCRRLVLQNMSPCMAEHWLPVSLLANQI